jgi:hypothetical protein
MMEGPAVGAAVTTNPKDTEGPAGSRSDAAPSAADTAEATTSEAASAEAASKPEPEEVPADAPEGAEAAAESASAAEEPEAGEAAAAASVSAAAAGAAASAAATATPAEAPRSPQVVAPESDGGAVVPVPGTLRQEKRPSFWKRISLRGGAGREVDQERLMARLDVIESRITAAELQLGNRIQRLDDRFTEVWEVEEQLSQMNDLRATLEEIASRQLRLTEQMRSVSGRLTLIPVLVVVAIGVGVAALLLP